MLWMDSINLHTGSDNDQTFKRGNLFVIIQSILEDYFIERISPESTFLIDKVK